MLEVKANALEESFDAILQADRIAGIEERVDALGEAMKMQAERAAQTANRPPLDGAKGSDVDPARAAFTANYLRRGVEAGVELKSLSGASAGAGGYAVPREIDQMIETALKAISPIRAVANVVRTGTAGYRKLVTTGGVVSGWASETGSRAETGTPTFQEIAPPSGELYANPAASQAMLDDAQFDVESWLADEIAREFARAEGAAFVSGNGTNKPKGFLTYTATNEADSVRAFGSLQYVASGAAGGFAASNPQDKLIDLVQALNSAYRQGAVFVMNSATLSRIRKFKTSDGAFLWQPSLAAGAPATLLGYPRLAPEGGGYVAGGGINTPCARWHADFAARAQALGFGLILSLSYELLDTYCPDAWKQRAFDGSPALTGWSPPSTLLSPANDDAMGWLRAVARAFAAIARDAGLAVRFQIGEPWWWVIAFDAPPEAGVDVTAGFAFDVPVRFAEDRLEIDRETFAAGIVPSVPLVEIRQ